MILFRSIRPKVLLIPLCLAFFSLFFTSLVSAHVLKSDGPIGAVMHIDPDDDPIVGQEATFFLDFSDKKSTFSLEDCACSFHIIQDEAEVFSTDLKPIEEGSNSAAGFNYIFKEKGIYQIKLKGSSVDAVSFPNFELNYDWRVDREGGSSTSGNSFVEQNLHFILLGSILLVFLAIVFSSRMRRIRLKEQEGE